MESIKGKVQNNIATDKQNSSVFIVESLMCMMSYFLPAIKGDL